MWHALIGILAAVAAGLLLDLLVFRLLLSRLLNGRDLLKQSLQRRLYRLLQILLPLLLVLLVIPSLELPAELAGGLRRLLGLGGIVLLGVLTANLVLVGRDLLLSRYDITAEDNLKAREVTTQVRVLVRILLVVIALVTAASALMIFDQVRQLGTSILASAGVLSLIVGFAAQRSIATLLAGLQLALTQPIRIDDVVIVDNEWGRIEEITLTYVVIRIWDLRRLVVPTSYFLEHSFQNWTRVSADLLGAVSFHVDYRVPIAALRNQLEIILKDQPLWDGKIWNLQVTEAGERTLVVRALMTAANSGNAWDLRCAVREELLLFLQQNYPDALPRVRVEVQDNQRTASGGAGAETDLRDGG